MTHHCYALHYQGVPKAMRMLARGRVRCLVGFAVAIGLVTLLSPLPFTSSTPRVKDRNPTQPHSSQSPFHSTQTKPENDRRQYQENTEIYHENSGKDQGNFDLNEKPGENREETPPSVDKKNREHKENKDGNGRKLNEDNESSGGSRGNLNRHEKISSNKENQDEIKQTAAEEPESNQVEEEEKKGKVEDEEEEVAENPNDIEIPPPQDWVEVKKIKPKKIIGEGGKEVGQVESKDGVERGKGKDASVGEGGTSLGGKKTDITTKLKNRKKGILGKSVENTLGHWPKELQERAASLPESSPVHAFLREQSRRVARVAEVCRNLQPSLAEVVAGSRGPPVGLLAVKDIIYDRKNQLTFCPVYKAASTSMTTILLQLGRHWTPRTSILPLQKVVKMFYPKLSGLSAASITTNTTHFMVVRHPLERLLSCYRDKFQLASKDYYYHIYGEKMVRLHREALRHLPKEKVDALQEEVRLALIKYKDKNGDNAGEGDFLHLPENPFANPVGPTFREFAEYVAAAKHDDEHWRSYVTHCAACILNYDFVLRFESLQEETKLFLEYLNRTGEVSPQRRNYNTKAETGEVFCHFYSQLSLELIDKLVAKYKKDLIMYEYDAQAYRRCAQEYQNGSRSDDGDGGGGGGMRSLSLPDAPDGVGNNGLGVDAVT